MLEVCWPWLVAGLFTSCLWSAIGFVVGVKAERVRVARLLATGGATFAPTEHRPRRRRRRRVADVTATIWRRAPLQRPRRRR